MNETAGCNTARDWSIASRFPDSDQSNCTYHLELHPLLKMSTGKKSQLATFKGWNLEEKGIQATKIETVNGKEWVTEVGAFVYVFAGKKYGHLELE